MSATGHIHTHTQGADAGNPDRRRRLLIAGLTWGFAVVEVFVGWH